MDSNMELKMICGYPVNFENKFQIHPLRIKEIAEMGLDAFQRILGYLLIENKNVDLPGISIDSYSYMCLLASERVPDGLEFVDSLKRILQEELTPVLGKDEAFLVIGDESENRQLTKDAFFNMQEIVRKQYFLSSESAREYKPANERAAQLKQRLEEMKKKLSQQNLDKKVDLGDIVSIVSAYTPNLNLFDVLELTVYQLYNMYLRLIMKDSYEADFQKYLVGVDPNDLEFKHWASKLST